MPYVNKSRPYKKEYQQQVARGELDERMERQRARRAVDKTGADSNKNGKAYVVDYKTGKSSRYADKDQLELMALAIFKHFPEITKINAGLLFVVCNALVKEKYSVDQQDMAWEKWMGEYDKLTQSYADNVWNPKPSGLCRNHCAVLSCPHNGRN